MDYIFTFFNCLYAQDFNIIKDVKYFEFKKNSLDIYMPKNRFNKKVIFMVHGGAWMIGKKTSKSVVKNKVNYFLNKGYSFISVDYRLVPKVDVLEQVKDIARALKFSQDYMKKFNVKEEDYILVGHSAGAHLVSLLTTNKKLQKKFNITRWKGTISLDSAALDVNSIMENKHRKFYDLVFGKNKAFWSKVSPNNYIETNTIAFLAVCSKKEKTLALKVNLL